MPRATLIFASIVVVAVAFLATPAAACPDCYPGKVARAQVLENDFAANLAIAFVPFIIIGGISMWADRIGRPRRATD